MESRGIDRRTFLSRGMAAGGVVALGVAGGGALAGCSSGGTTGTTATTAGGASGPPRRGGTLSVGTTADIDGFYPPDNHWDTNGFLYANAVYDPWMAVAADGTIQPYLAESLTHNAAYDVWTMTLRPGVHFHDGSVLDAAAAHANFVALRSSTLTGPALAQLTSVTTPDDLTVVFTLDHPSTGFAAALTSQAAYPVAPAMIRAAASGNSAPTPIGTGPFTFASWSPNEQFTAVRNPHYWRAGLPYLDQVTFRPIGDTTQREATLRTGGVDVIYSIEPTTYTHFAGQPGFRAYEPTKVIGEPTMGFLMLNLAVAPTDDLRVRQALAKATDQQQLQRLFSGRVQPANGLFLSDSPYYSDTGYPTHDPAGARRLVAAYAAEHGTPTLTISTVSDPQILDLVQAVQQMWTQVGVHVSIAIEEQATLISDAVVGSFQVIPSAQFGAVNPDTNYFWLSTTTVEPVGTIGLNFARNRDPVIEQAMITARSTLDPATRIAAWRTVNERLAVDLPYLWIGQDVFPVVTSDRVEGLFERTLPGGRAGYAYDEGLFWPTQLWLDA